MIKLRRQIFDGIHINDFILSSGAKAACGNPSAYVEMWLAQASLPDGVRLKSSVLTDFVFVAIDQPVDWTDFVVDEVDRIVPEPFKKKLDELGLAPRYYYGWTVTKDGIRVIVLNPCSLLTYKHQVEANCNLFLAFCPCITSIYHDR